MHLEWLVFGAYEGIGPNSPPGWRFGDYATCIWKWKGYIQRVKWDFKKALAPLWHEVTSFSGVVKLSNEVILTLDFSASLTIVYRT